MTTYPVPRRAVSPVLRSGESAAEPGTSADTAAGARRPVLPGRRSAHRLWAGAAAGWTLLYVASKVHYAIEDRLGVTGGPDVPAARYDAFAPGEVAAAQWANAAVGGAVVLLFAFCVLPIALRLPRWLLSVPIGGVAVMAAAGAVGMLGRALLTDSGGALFGGYCAAWAALAVGTFLAVQRATR